MRYSFIIPVSNRPEEVDELLNSLTTVSYTHLIVGNDIIKFLETSPNTFFLATRKKPVSYTHLFRGKQ